MVNIITSSKSCEAAEAGTKAQRDIPVDGSPGLALRVTSAGLKTWCLRYRRQSDGKQRRMTLGPYPDVGLSEARRRARDARDEASEGADPADAKRHRREAENFRDLSDAWLLSLKAKDRSEAYLKDVRGLLKVHVLPALGDVKVGEVKKKDVLAMLDAISAQGRTHRPNRAHACVRGVYRWAMSEDRVTFDPTAGIKARRKEEARDRILTDEEVRRLWIGLDTAPMTEPVRIAIRLALLTGQRIGEITGMRVEHVSVEAARWTVPKENAKNRQRHDVPLSPMALDIVKHAVANARDGWLFWSIKTAGGLDSHVPTRAWDRARGGMKLGDVRIHDLRRSAASGMAMLGITPDVIGKVLNHQSTANASITSAVYIRYGFDDQKRRALDLWAGHVARVIAGDVSAAGNVVPMRREGVGS